MKNEEINRQILDLWKYYSNKGGEGTRRYPLFYPDFNINCDVLFIGINPSFLNKMGEEIFKFENEKFKIDEDIERERDAKEKSYATYFRRIWKIKEKLNLNSWEHIDLFLIRDKTQNVLKEVIQYDNKKFNEFGEAQFKLFLKILNKINPRVIVVINALASDIINNKLKEEIENNSNFEKEGFDRIFSKKIPILFSGYLGSGRLDNHSFRRLTWQIKQALKSVNK